VWALSVIATLHPLEVKELAEATALRKKERAHYTATHKDFSESITAIAKVPNFVQGLINRFLN